jgi:Carboxypeptidase regulatory-like domain
MRANAWIRSIAALMVLLCAGQVWAQGSKKEPQLRSVRGIVTDKDEKAVANGVVFLKNLRTNVVLSHFTDEQGAYRFSGLDPNVDYEIHAEAGDLKSAPRTVTSLDSRKEITLNLKLDRKKG